MRILVVDDDEIVQETLKLGLESIGYKVSVSWDEKTTLEKIQTEPPDVILMDISIPGIDGITLCRQIKQTPGMMETPILIITAYGDSKTYHDAFLFGACDYITKPFDIMEVKKKIETAIERQRRKI